MGTGASLSCTVWIRTGRPKPSLSSLSGHCTASAEQSRDLSLAGQPLLALSPLLPLV